MPQKRETIRVCQKRGAVIKDGPFCQPSMCVACSTDEYRLVKDEVAWAPKWITFVEFHFGAGTKTRLWQIQEKDGGAILGRVRWYSPWRKYAFFPEEGTLYEPDCLLDIAQFLSTKTAERKAERAAEKAAGGK